MPGPRNRSISPASTWALTVAPPPFRDCGPPHETSGARSAPSSRIVGASLVVMRTRTNFLPAAIIDPLLSFPASSGPPRVEPVLEALPADHERHDGQTPGVERYRRD